MIGLGPHAMTRARENVVSVLQAIASKDQQYEWYVATGGRGNLARELWTFWMKDAYIPHQREFVDGFTRTEHEQLERFTQFFESRLAEFPQRFEKLMIDIYWASVIEYAQRLLDDLVEEDRADE